MKCKDQDKKEEFLLNYDFDLIKDGIYQTIFYGHLFGTTFSIGALFEPRLNEDGNITSMKSCFMSKNMGGIINFALQDVQDTILVHKKDKNKTVHRLLVKLWMNTDKDSKKNLPSIVNFSQPFRPNNDWLQVSIKDEDIVNLLPDMLADPCEKDENSKPGIKVNDDRSCNNNLGGGNG